MATTIQSLVQSAAAGATITVPPGTYNVSGLVLPSNITLQASGNVTLVGNMSVKGPETVVSGFTFSGGKIDISNSNGVTIQDCVFNGGSTSVALDGARDALISGNEFHDVTGGVLIGWGLDKSTISENKFYNCYQPIDLLFNNNTSQGRDITISDNYFTGTKRMPLEVGPIDAYTSNMVVKGNWSENMSNVGQQDGYHTDVAFSVVPTNGVNTLIEGNYASGPGTGVGIEMAGSGEITGNYVKDFWYGVIVYNGGFNVHDNALVNQSIETVLNYGNQSGTIQNNQTTAAGFSMPQKPGTTSDSGGTVPDSGTATPPPPSGDSSGGTGNPVIAVDDDNWSTGVNSTMWQAARYLTWNDKGADGGLKVTAVAAKSAAGGSISFDNGTIIYKPKAGWQGKDAVQYTVADKDGSSDTGTFYVKVGSGGTTVPDSGSTPLPGGSTSDGSTSGGSGNPVTAVDDDNWSTGVNSTMWQAARYLTWNDKGADGGLKVTAVAAKSAAGGSISFDNGTIIYKPKAGWQGKDAVQYTVADKDGSSDTGTFYVKVGSGGPVMSVDTSSGGTSTGGSTSSGSGNPVDANNDHWNAKAGQPLWFNSRYLLQNDKAPDGGLAVKSIAATTAKGGSINWDADTGTTIYRAKAGFTGKDYVHYTAVDADGSTDTAQIHFDVLLA